ncbi:hypothetical protein [Mesorhizobium sp. M1153]|uniref:hypothetical protein n=1 Tax=Mesorhizobium sp. M1153 TaxID=2957063 RepID=UPI00333CCE4B
MVAAAQAALKTGRHNETGGKSPAGFFIVVHPKGWRDAGLPNRRIYCSVSLCWSVNCREAADAEQFWRRSTAEIELTSHCAKPKHGQLDFEAGAGNSRRAC